MPLSHEDIRALVAAFDNSEWDELTVASGGTRLTLARNGPPASPADRAPRAAVPPAATEPPPPVPATPSATASGESVTAPSVGIFWRSPQPGAPPFVEVGDEVCAEDALCILEVMKLMTHVRAGIAGVVRAIHPANGQMVEHGETLFTIEPVP